MKIYKCPECGEDKKFNFDYDYSEQHRPVKNVWCLTCGEVFDGNMPVAELQYKYTEGKGFTGYLKTFEQIQEENIYSIAEKEFQNVGDEGLFPNHTDKDIWISGFVAAVNYIKTKQ